MSELHIINRAFLKDFSQKSSAAVNGVTDLTWQTCLRQVFFFYPSIPKNFELLEGDQHFSGAAAEAFLAEVLCGLKSPLIGETEVFGQFKLWWSSIPTSHLLKQILQSRIETVYALVKNVRERTLCGLGSQSYGSILRRNLVRNTTVDIIGAGQLAQDMLPWIQNKTAFRIWCRRPEAATFTKPENLLAFDLVAPVSDTVVVAAPMTHDDLNAWLKLRGFSSAHKLYDLRADAALFVPFVKPAVHMKLQDFSSKFEVDQLAIQKKASEASALIQAWAESQLLKAQVRPYGWDDL